MENISILNKRLVETYGHTYDNRPLFRIVHSATQYEKRYGIFNVFCGSIFLREETCMKEVPKYSYVKPAKHILEELKFGNFPDMPYTLSNYEPIWAFMDKNRQPLYPVWPVVQIVVKSRLEGIRKTLSDYNTEANDEKMAEIKEFENILGVSDGVGDMKNQKVNFVKPLFLAGGDTYWIKGA